MKTLASLFAVMTFVIATHAQSFTNLCNFTYDNGAQPDGELVLAGNVLYGTTDEGGTNGLGVIFKINTDGTGFTQIYDFSNAFINGEFPEGGLTLDGDTLYGTTAFGGSSGQGGTVFAVNTDGSGFMVLKDFSADGFQLQPNGTLVLNNGTLYGMTLGNSGASNFGMVYKVDTDGSNYAAIHIFLDPINNETNSEGANPYTSLVLSGNTLYGATSWGGTFGYGTLFHVNTDGGDFSVIYNFTNNGDVGANLRGALILSGRVLYGTTVQGNSDTPSTIYSINTDGSNFTVLKSDLDHAAGNLVLSGNVLYGTTELGLAYKINTDGTGYTILKNLNGEIVAGMTLSGNVLYGTTYEDNNNPSIGLYPDYGSVFKLNLTSLFNTTLSITQNSSNQMVLTWTDTNFSLQSATNVTGDYTTIGGATSSYTNTITGTQQFFRLIGN